MEVKQTRACKGWKWGEKKKNAPAGGNAVTEMREKGKRKG